MRVLTSPSDCGAVTLALPQDVQAEAFDYPEELFRKRVWLIRRPQPDTLSLQRAVEAIRSSRKPLMIAGGGVLMSEAWQALDEFVAQTGIPVAETQAGKGSLPWDHPQSMGAIGATGTLAANRLAHFADLVIGIGTRYSDFTSASMTAFQNPQVRFVNINTAEFDAYKVASIPVVADARIALEQLTEALTGYRVAKEYAAEAAGLKTQWESEVDRLFHLNKLNKPGKPAQSEVIGAMWEAAGERDVLLSAAGSHPGDLHKLWRTRTPNGYHMEYGYSCMGYEIPAAIGAKMADPSREVYVFLGDGTYQMMPTEIVTSVQEGVKIIIVLVDNHGFGSIGALSRSLGQGEFGTRYRFRSQASGQLDGDPLTVDFAANACSLGAHALKAATLDELKQALLKAKTLDRTTVIVVETDPAVSVPGYESWWDVAVAEVSEMESVRAARILYEEARKRERFFL
jgi:3D-(3,5/4)-trihydroxycyclohexane-1,2-dione acylhydrolase (decyclizing)